MALYYELELLEDLISITLHPKNLSNESFVKNNSNEWLRIATSEIERIKKSLKAGLLACKKEKSRLTYIRQHQVGIVNLQDLLYQYQSSLQTNNPFTRKKVSTKLQLFQQLTELLDDLLFFFDRHFNPVFKEDPAIAVSTAIQFQTTAIEKLKAIKPVLFSFSTDHQLPDLVIEIISALCNNLHVEKTTLPRLNYLSYLLQKLETIPQHIVIGYYPVLIQLLIHLNFNSPLFINYLLQTILKEINDTDTDIEKWERLCFHYKEIKQVNALPGMALNPSAISVQKHIAAYLLSEKKYFKKLKTLSLFSPLKTNTAVEEEQEGIHLQLSVEELGLLTNVQKQAGLLKNPNMRSLAKLLAASHRSLRRDKISWQNLYNCFSKVEMNTINSLDDKLITMVNTLRKIKSDLKKN